MTTPIASSQCLKRSRWGSSVEGCSSGKPFVRQTRRQFLSAAALSVAGWTRPAQRRLSAAHAPNEKLHIGVIGVGNRGVSNTAELTSENIVALCDVDRQYLAAMSARHPHAKTYVDFHELVEQPDLDAVLISLPDHTHFHAAALSMQRGLAVYCEKPLAHSIWEVRQLEAMAKSLGVVTQTGNQHHASDGYRRVAEIIQAEAIGSVTEVHAWTNRPIWPQGIERPTEQQSVPQGLEWELWLGPAPKRPYNAIYHPRAWRGWFDFGCGALGDMGPHLLDPAIWALDLKSPTVVSAKSSPVNDETFPVWSVVRYEFQTAAGRPPLRLTWYDGNKKPPESVTGVKRLPANGVLFIAERAKLFAPEYGRQPIVLPHQAGEDIELPDPFLPKSPGHHREWINACKGRGTTSCDFSYGRRLTELCLLGNLAIRTGETIHVEGDRITAESGLDLLPLIKRDYRESWAVPTADTD